MRWKIALWIFAGALALLVAGRIALPYVLQSQIETRASAALGVPVQIGEVKLSLLNGEATLRDLSVGGIAFEGAPAPDDLFHLDEASVRVRLAPTLSGIITLDEVKLLAPRIRLRKLADGRLDASLIGRSDDGDSAEAPESEADPLRIFVRQFDLRNLDLVFADESAEPNAPISLVIGSLELSKFSLSGEAIEIAAIALRDGRIAVAGEAPLAVAIDIEAAKITNSHGQSFPLTIQTTIEEIESEAPEPRLALQGELIVEPPGFDGRIEASRLPMPVLAAAFDPGPITSWLHSGRLSSDLALGLESVPASGQNIRIGGKITIDDFQLANRLDDESREIDVAWKSLLFDMRETTVALGREGRLLASPDVRISEISLVAPVVFFTSPSTAIAAITSASEDPDDDRPEATPAATSSEPEAIEVTETTAPRIRLDFAKISNGRFEFVDRSTSPSFHDEFENIELEITQVDLQKQTIGSLDLRLKADDATLAVQGAVGNKKEIDVKLDKLDLAPFNAYALTHAGYVIERGRLSLDSVISQRGAQVAAKSSLTLHELNVKEAKAGGFKDQFGVPLSMGLALLRDVDGNIVLPIQMETADGESAVQIGPVLFQAFRSAIVGAITSPLKLLQAAVPGADEPASTLLVPYEAGTATFDEEGAAQIASVAKLLATRPALGVALRGQVGPLDRAADKSLEAEGKLDLLGNARIASLREYLHRAFSIATHRIRLDPQVPVGPPGVLIAVEVPAQEP